MERIFKWSKKNCKKILFVIMLCMIIINIMPNNSVFAEITHIYDENGHLDDSGISDGDGLGNKILAFFGNASMGILGIPFSSLINAFSVVVFITLSFLFSSAGMTKGALGFPFPDDIVFNRIPFFDPNFINPPTVNGNVVSDSPVAVMQNIIQNMYQSFFILAGTIFVIAALIIGIKLALSSLASQKAMYKQALMNWVFGIFLLFTVHFLMAGIFYFNERIVATAYSIINEDDLVFEINGGILDVVEEAGKKVSNMISWLGKFVTGDEEYGEDFFDGFKFKGYRGFLITTGISAVSGDLTSSIIFAIIIGQSVALVVMYTKRLFYCITLGLMAPLIVAVDVIKKSI